MKKTQKRVLIVLFVLILVLVLIISGLWILESTVFRNETDVNQTVSKTITRNGIKYFPRQDMTTVLLMGIDQYGPVESSGSYRNYGESDVVMILCFDEKSKDCHILALNRDTMLEMPALGLGGKQAGTFYGQLALSHTYGSGLEDSCENTKKTVSNFLNGIQIDYYLSVNMDAIAVMNDAVGGVTVNVTEDFSALDPSITKGIMKLMGQQSINYVRGRMDVGTQLNISRMERQKGYMNSFMERFHECISGSDSFAVQLYADIAPYIVTDISTNAFNGMVKRYSDYEIVEIVSPEGINDLGSEFYEFYVDEEKLDDLILRLFYAAK